MADVGDGRDIGVGGHKQAKFGQNQLLVYAEFIGEYE
jgi:hypothetical protein